MLQLVTPSERFYFSDVNFLDIVSQGRKIEQGLFSNMQRHNGEELDSVRRDEDYDLLSQRKFDSAVATTVSPPELEKICLSNSGSWSLATTSTLQYNQERTHCILPT